MFEAGDAFGEVALVAGGPRTATIRASGPVEALRLDAAVFAGLVLGTARRTSSAG